MLKMSEATRKYKIFCPHCDRDVSKSTWYSHYGQFYNNRKKKWTKFEDQHSEEAFDFGAAPPDGSSGKLNASQGASDPDDQTSHIIVGGQVDFSVPESGMFSGHNAPLLYCSYVRYPKHPQVRMRAPCNTRLLKEV